MPSTASDARLRLRALANPATGAFLQRYFKTGPGEYGEGDVFLGIKVPLLRALAKEFAAMPLKEVDALLCTTIHEERLLALMILVLQFRRGDPKQRGILYRHYLRRTRYINNWDLVDGSAAEVVGAYLASRDLAPLDRLASSPRWWERRIAVLATLHFIRRKEFAPTLDLAARLLEDTHDLMHKAVGWMLREIGKRDEATLRTFLDQHCNRMPRTMLRYAIERLPPVDRTTYLEGKKAFHRGPARASKQEMPRPQ